MVIPIKKFISLLSGGLDSPIAAFIMMQRGFIPIFLSFLTSDDFEDSMKKKVVKIVKILSTHTDENLKIYFIVHDNNLEAFKRVCDRKLTCVLCKRLMLRIAKQLGKLEQTNIIVTGDILGEQASQTLDNLYSYNNIIQDFILLRPLIGCDKQEVININKKIGLYDTTSQSSAGCQFNPQYPETHAKMFEVENSELKVDLSALVEESINSAEVLKF
jgi:thiamine biosynthesis protein ThiI